MAPTRRARHLHLLQLKNLHVPGPDPCCVNEEGIEHQHALNFTLEAAASVQGQHTAWQPLYSSEQLLNDLDLVWDPIQLTAQSSNNLAALTSTLHQSDSPQQVEGTGATVPITDWQQLRLTVYFTPVDAHRTCSYTTVSAACWAAAHKPRRQMSRRSEIQASNAKPAAASPSSLAHVHPNEASPVLLPPAVPATISDGASATNQEAHRLACPQQHVALHVSVQEDGHVHLQLITCNDTHVGSSSSNACGHREQQQEVQVLIHVLHEDHCSLQVMVGGSDTGAEQPQPVSAQGKEGDHLSHLGPQSRTAARIATNESSQQHVPSGSVDNAQQLAAEHDGQTNDKLNKMQHRRQRQRQHSDKWACRLLQLEFNLADTVAVDAAVLDQAARGVNLVLLHMKDGSVCVPARIQHVAGVTFLPPPTLLCRVTLQPLPDDIIAAARQLTRQVSLKRAASGRMGNSSSAPSLQAAADLAATGVPQQGLQEQLARWMVDNGSVFAPLGTQNSLDEELSTSGLFDSQGAAAVQQLMRQAVDDMPGPVASGAGFVPAFINSLFGQSGSASTSTSPSPHRLSKEGNALTSGVTATTPSHSNIRSSNHALLPPIAPAPARTSDASKRTPLRNALHGSGICLEPATVSSSLAESPFAAHRTSASDPAAILPPTHRRAASASNVFATPVLNQQPFPGSTSTAGQIGKISISGQLPPSRLSTSAVESASLQQGQDSATATRLYAVEDLQSSTRRLMGVYQRLAAARAARQRSTDRINQLLEQSQCTLQQQLSLQQGQQRLQQLTATAQGAAAQLAALQELYDSKHHDLQKRCKQQGMAAKALKAAQERLRSAQETLAGPNGWGLWREGHAAAAGQANALVTTLAAAYQLGPKGAGLLPHTQSWLQPATPAFTAPAAGSKPGIPRAPVPLHVAASQSTATDSEREASYAGVAGSSGTGTPTGQEGLGAGPQRGLSTFTRLSNRSGMSTGRHRVTPSLEEVLTAQPIDAVMDASWWAAGASDTADSNAMSRQSSLGEGYPGESEDGLVDQLGEAIERALMASTPSASQPGSGCHTPVSSTTGTPHAKTSRLSSPAVDPEEAAQQLPQGTSSHLQPPATNSSKPASVIATQKVAGNSSPIISRWFGPSSSTAVGGTNGAVALCVSGLELPGNLVQRCLEGSAGWGWGSPDEEQRIAAALGYVAHMVDRLSYYLDVPLRYPLLPGMSKSHICDPAPLTNPVQYHSSGLLQRSLGRLMGSTLAASNGHTTTADSSEASLTSPTQWLLGNTPIGQLRNLGQLEPSPTSAQHQQKSPQKTVKLRVWMMAAAAGKGREGTSGAAPLVLPLFTDGRDRGKFAYAVYLLNKDVEQLLQAHGLPSSGPNQLLRNLYSLALVAASGIMM